MKGRVLMAAAAAGIALLLVAASASELQRGGAGQPPAPRPTQVDVMVPMRDGVPLGADVYLPEGNGPFPVLLTLTPYGKNAAAQAARRYLARGYAVVAADSRGLRASKGTWIPYVNEGRDGYDLQQWVGKQPWSNGKIGMFGTSYPAFTQLLPAQYRSEYVKALVPIAAQSDNFGSVWATDGFYHLAFLPAWPTRQEAIATGKTVPEINWNKLLWHLPLKDIPNQIPGIRSPFLVDVLAHDRYTEFWKSMSIRGKHNEMDVPALHVTGWYDDLTEETLQNYIAMRKQSRSEHARRWQRLLVGPWGHGVRPQRIFGDVDFGPDVQIDFQEMELRWFDYHVKGIENGLDKEAPVKIFVMGENKWRDEQEWPLARAQATRYYFHSQGFANTRFGDGVLTTTHPQAEPVDRYRYDPRNPVPTSGGHGCCTGDIAPTGPLDQRVTQQRPDVLVYTTPPLEQDTEVTGPMSARLFFSTDVPDTDFIVTLADVAPDGKAIQITEGQVRTRFRESLERPSMLVPNRDYEVAINLWCASNVFKKGHRIRVHLTSSNFPRFNRNLNSGKPLGDETDSDIRIANQVIYHDSRRPSSIVLPIVPGVSAASPHADRRGR